MGGKNQQPVAFSSKTGLFYVPTNNLCMDYEGVEVKYQAGQPYVGAIVVSHPGPGGNRGEFIAWDPATGKKVLKQFDNTVFPSFVQVAPGGTFALAGVGGSIDTVFRIAFFVIAAITATGAVIATTIPKLDWNEPRNGG